MSDSDAERELWNAAWTHVSEQDRQRGPWVSPRRGEMPEPPWPATDNPVLRALLDQARRNLQVDGVETALIHLATHAWFEGGIEGYDRGQRDARGGPSRR
ncbi:hypothetical protein ACQP1U_06275 [Actinomycetota bacterium]